MGTNVSVGRVIAICIALLAPAALRAAEDKTTTEAKAAYLEGKAAYERGDYERALERFSRANLLLPAPTLSYNMGKTYEHLGRFREAVQSFDRYLEQQGAPTNPEEQSFQDNLRVRIANLKTRPDQAGVARPATPPPATPGGETQPPPPVNPQYNVYYYPQPGTPAYNPYYQGYTIAPPSKLDLAKKRRGTGIGLLVSGLVIDVALGVPLIAAGVVYDVPGVTYTGAFFFAVGFALWLPGAILVAIANAEIAKLATPQPVGQPMSVNEDPARRRAAFEVFASDGRRGALPNATVFALPPIRF